MSKLYYLLGKPISHSISPLFWNETFKTLGLDAIYVAKDVSEKELSETLRAIENSEVVGANITIPYKQTAAKQCKELHGIAKQIEVVNTVVSKEKRLNGWNTDFSGLLSIFKDLGKFNNVAVLGSGASSKTTLAALREHGCANIIQIARKFSDNNCINDEQNYVIKKSWNYNNFVDSLTKSDIIINTTPIGWKSDDNIPGFAEGLFKDKVFLDFNYSKVSQLIAIAAEKKCRVIGGAELLLRQALDSFRIFLGEEPPVQVMRQAVYKYIS